MVGAVTVRLQMDWTDWNQIKVEIDNKERILHHNLELYLIIEMSCMQEHSRTFRKVPEPSGTFLVWCKNIPEASGRFRKLPEGSGTFLVGAPGSCIYGMSCIALYGLC